MKAQASLPALAPSPALPVSASGPPSSRLISVDALRGFDMFWIIGGDYLLRSLPRIHDDACTRGLATQMEHCEWAGFHFYDLIFPLFVFLVGVSIAFSTTRTIERDGRKAALRRIVIRSVVLFLLGIFYMGGVAHGFANVYLAGVLQRIAVAYGFAAALFCFLRPRGLMLLCAGLLLGYWALMTLVPVPGIGAPSLEVPGKNLAHYIDTLYLPGQKFEGTLLSTLAAVANCLLGVLAGLLLKSERLPGQQKVLWLLGSGILSLLLGFGWAQAFPIIKLLWTSSYVLVACGYSAILLALFYQVIELWGFRQWAQPFVWVGMNAITVYLVAGVVNFHRLAERFVGGDVRAALGSYADLAAALVTLALGFWLVNFLYRRKVFLRV
jgi:predicted acyltransferase